jgi:hypothetical protein
MRLASFFTTLVLAVALGLVAGPEKAIPQDDQSKNMITPATQEAIDAGLAYLARTQNDDGSFGTGHWRGNVAVTSLCGLAMMAGGNQPGRGRYGTNVRRAVENILSYEVQNGDNRGYIFNQNSGVHGPFYAHGFATLFLAEAHGMVDQKPLRDQLRKTLGESVDLIVRKQNRQGGWRYHPGDGDADISATICQIMALRAAHNAGITVPKSTADRCIQYVKNCQDKASGGFRYQPNGGPPGFARTAAGIVALYSAGIYEGEELDKALDYLMRNRPGAGGGGGFLGNFDGQVHYHYGNYYAVQATWIAGGKYWRDYYPAIRDELLSNNRRADGSWSNSQFDPHYCTAMSLIILQVPNRYLPIMQR